MMGLWGVGRMVLLQADGVVCSSQELSGAV